MAARERELQVGDRVRITDGSQATRLDAHEISASIGLSSHDFEVLWVSNIVYELSCGMIFHDIHIQDLENGRIYLHSSPMVKKVLPSAKELTVAEISEKLGYEVKIIK